MLRDKSDFLLYLKCTRTSTHTFYMCRPVWVKFGMQDLYVIALTEFRENLCDESHALPEVAEEVLPVFSTFPLIWMQFVTGDIHNN